MLQAQQSEVSQTYLEDQLIMLIKALQICQDALQGLLQALILLLPLHLLNQQVSKVVLQSRSIRPCIWHLPLPGLTNSQQCCAWLAI